MKLRVKKYLSNENEMDTESIKSQFESVLNCLYGIEEINSCHCANFLKKVVKKHNKSVKQTEKKILRQSKKTANKAIMRSK